MNREPRYGKAEEARDTRAALVARPEWRVVRVDRYVAQGLATARIDIQCTKFPDAVELIDARPYFDQGGPLTLSPSFSFVWDAPSKTARVYEPGGLTSNVAYRLTFRVIGG